MRVTTSMYYDNLFSTNNSKLTNKLFDVNQQIASGLKIKYASDDVSAFVETMRLDNELTTLAQVKKSTESGYKVSNQSDVVLNEFTDTMNRMRTLFLQSANSTNDVISQDAIAGELRGLETNLRSLANTSINGQYLFSGSAVNKKPILNDGSYDGNSDEMNAALGSNQTQKYNITGSDLFLGEEILINREISSNVVNHSIDGQTVDNQTVMSNFMGTVPAGRNHNFYLRGTTSNGTSINEKIQLTNTSTMDDLLKSIGTAYGNTGSIKVASVAVNSSGQITVQDKIQGSSKIEFHLVAASDFNAVDQSNVTNIDSLVAAGVTDYNLASTNGDGLFIREFNNSGYTAASGAPTDIEGVVFDRTKFAVVGNKLTSSIPQILNKTNAFATDSTKLIDVASGTSLNGKQFTLKGKDVNDVAVTMQIDFKNQAGGGSTFSIDGGVTNYTIFDMNTPRGAVDSDKMTYRQLMDTINMAITSNLPNSTNSETDYDNAASVASDNGKTFLSDDGKISFNDLKFISTKATIALYDSNSGSFNTGEGSVMLFNANNSLSIRDPKTDFFKDIDDMIRAVEDHKLFPDSTTGRKRNVGIENAMAKMDDLQSHIFKIQSIAGAQSNTLDSSLQRISLLEVSTAELRSQVVDTDLAEASLTLTQLNLTYQAMLSTVGKVSQLSLVNFL